MNYESLHKRFHPTIISFQNGIVRPVIIKMSFYKMNGHHFREKVKPEISEARRASAMIMLRKHVIFLVSVVTHYDAIRSCLNHRWQKIKIF